MRLGTHFDTITQLMGGINQFCIVSLKFIFDNK